MKLILIEYNKGIIWVDQEAKVKKRDTYFNTDYKYIKTCIETTKEVINPLVYFQEGSTVFDYSIDCLKIIAQSTNLSLPNIPYVEVNEEKSWIELDGIAGDILTAHLKEVGSDSSLYTLSTKVLRPLIIAGYKAASTKKYTEEDLKRAFNSGREKRVLSFPNVRTTADEYVKSLQPKVVSIEIETTRFYDGHLDHFEYMSTQYQRDGKIFLKVKSIQYEKSF